MINKTDRKANRTIRQKRVRTKVQGTALRPRLCVTRTNTSIYAQVIDDEKQVTICSASTLDPEVKTKGSNVAAAQEVGKLIAERAKKAKVNTVVFDRNGYLYHGKVEALAEAARAAGLEF